ncbi:MAG: hypothetical protein GX817_01560 [Elusimicrobia bacterium]|nr:hypothetical protein [Elusimicrobiota bacterium]
MRKDNTVWFMGNRYSVPLGTYVGTEKVVEILEAPLNVLVINDPETGQELARHDISIEKGRLIKNNNHGRDHSRGIGKYIETVAALFSNPSQAQEWLEVIRAQKPRYIRDQLQVIQKSIKDSNALVIERALHYCLRHNLFSATDFRDAVDHFIRLQQQEVLGRATTNDPIEIKPLEGADRSKLGTKPVVRSFEYYKELLEGSNLC